MRKTRGQWLVAACLIFGMETYFLTRPAALERIQTLGLREVLLTRLPGHRRHVPIMTLVVGLGCVAAAFVDPQKKSPFFGE